MNNRKILYIAGYSRSGSTILDILLGSHRDMVGTGELVYLFDDWLLPERLCTCGEPYSNCNFWKNFKLPEGTNFNDAIEIIRRVECRSSLSKLINNKVPVDLIQKYNLVQTALYNYIFRTSQKNIIIDSSKTSRDMAGRYYALYKHTDFDVYVIHLVKNGQSVVESFVKRGSNWAQEGYKKTNKFLAVRSSLGWFLANSIAQRLGKRMPEKHFMQIKYEDLVSQPENILLEISSFLDTDLSEVMTMIKKEIPFHPKHNIGGNRLRLEKEIKFSKSYSSKKIGLSIYHRLIFNLIAGRLHKKLGY
jgi:hypothetical protein